MDEISQLLDKAKKDPIVQGLADVESAGRGQLENILREHSDAEYFSEWNQSSFTSLNRSCNPKYVYRAHDEELGSKLYAHCEDSSLTMHGLVSVYSRQEIEKMIKDKS